MKYLFIILLFIGCRQEIIKPQRDIIERDDRALFMPKSMLSKPIIKRFDSRIFRLLKDRVPRDAGVILLDFDGGFCTGTIWNYEFDTIYYSHSGLTPEQQKIVFDSIKYDFSPFRNLYVTTDEAVYQRANIQKRTRVNFTTSYEWYGPGAGGVAINGSFSTGSGSPAWVFTSQLQYVTKYISEAGSHEAGHTFTLRHQAAWSDTCTFISEYNYGNNILAPIMGVAYNARSGEWWIGPTKEGCNSIQDDKQIIEGKL
jgi:hypothetical protein